MTETKLTQSIVGTTIPKLYDLDLLQKRCTMAEYEFQGLGETVNGKYPEDWYVYIDRGADILGVAHLDYVADNAGFVSMEWEKDGQAQVVVWNGALDDRLGAFLLLDVLPTMNLNFDVLLTTNEEWARSTASDFKTDKNYKWIFEFDRRGLDVVMYDYETSELCDMLQSVDIKVGAGSYSDISELEHLGVSGFNFGTGYYQEHSKDHHAVLRDTEAMCWLFYRFFKKYEDTTMVYTPSPYKDSWYDYTHPSYDRFASREHQRHLYDIQWDNESVVLDVDVYEQTLDSLIESGMSPEEADKIAANKATNLLPRHNAHRDIGCICPTCEALVDEDEMWQGRCIYCRTVLDEYNGSSVHNLTDEEWEILEGGR